MANEGLDLFADGFSFLEFPRWHEGRLWAADMFAGQVVAFTADGAAQVVITVPEVLAGFGWMPDGSLLVVTRGGRLLRQEAGPAVEVPSPLSGGPVPCNEMTVDSQGRAYIGLFGLAGGGLARVDPDGSARVMAKGMLLPNGQALSADGRTLIVAESAGQRLSAFTVGADGSLTSRRVWATFGEPATATTLPEVIAQVSVWPDGIALDAAGAVWVANPFGREALRVVEGGEITDRLPTGELACCACALGGPDGQTLFLCAAPPFLDQAAYSTQRSARLLTCHVSVPAATSPCA
jgi:sugar lactone lactonase YvrE